MNNIEINQMSNEILKELFHQIMNIQERFVENSSDIKLSRTEIHILEIVGDEPGSILTDIANKLYITKATVSVSVNGLVKKELLKRMHLENDKRKQGLFLTDEGKKCYSSHAQFHNQLIEALMNDFKLNEKEELVKGLKQMLDFFKEFY
ncbi:MAG: MarR family transcriptional regulator [Eubacteriales bacterium]